MANKTATNWRGDRSNMGKAVSKQTGLPRKVVKQNPIGSPKAYQYNLMLGIDGDNQAHLLGTNVSYIPLRNLGTTIRADGGVAKVEGKSVQLTSAAIFRPGQKAPKRYTFKPKKAATKKKAAAKADE